MSKRARVVELWSVLKSPGRQGVIGLVQRLCDNARRFATKLQAAGFNVVNDVVLNQVLVCCEDDATTQQTIQHIQAAGECWCGRSSWDGKVVIRISVCDWATSESEINRSVSAFVAARELARREVV